MEYVQKEGRKIDRNITFKPLDVSKQINFSDYSALVILNSRMSTGTDPVLLNFLNSIPGGVKVIVVNVVKNRSSLSVQYSDRTESENGVDTITAASKWGRGNIRDMHKEWLTKLFELLQE